jgi:hypothetical protein
VLCAQCRRDDPSVKLREEFCPGFLCDQCYEYQRLLWKLLNFPSRELYDRVSEEGRKIEELRFPKRTKDLQV